MSTSSPSWIIGALVPYPKIIADVLVFINGLRGGWASFWDTKQESQDGNKEFGNPGRLGRRPAGPGLQSNSHEKTDEKQ